MVQVLDRCGLKQTGLWFSVLHLINNFIWADCGLFYLIGNRVGQAPGFSRASLAIVPIDCGGRVDLRALSFPHEDLFQMAIFSRLRRPTDLDARCTRCAGYAHAEERDQRRNCTFSRPLKN
jgi:hypothetical protein